MKKIIFLVTVVLLGSCKEGKPLLQANSIIKVPASPIYANHDKTEVLLSDYMAGDQTADSITAGEGVQLQPWSRTDSIVSFEMTSGPAVSLITLWTDGVRNDIPVFKSSSKAIRINYDKPAVDSKVQIKGEFTNWVPTDLQTDGSNLYYDATVPSGKFQYLFIIDGEEEQLTGTESNTISNGMGGFNRVIDNSRKAFPAQLSYGAITDGGFTFTASGTLDNVIILYENQKITATVEGNTYEVTLPEKDFPGSISKTQLVRVFASFCYYRYQAGASQFL